MKVLGVKHNFRVVLTPRGFGDFGFMSTSDSFVYGHGKEADERKARDYQDRCEDMARDAKRHVDNVSSADVECDQEPLCSYCGRLWTEESETYNGGCCSEDEENNPSPEDDTHG